MCLRQLVLNIKVDRVNEIDAHLDWADNYGLSDDDHEGWDFCKKLTEEREAINKEIQSILKYI